MPKYVMAVHKQVFSASYSDSSNIVLIYYSVVQASHFLNHFSSDRMHMWDEAMGRWSADPPTYQCIQPKGESSNNLMQYMDMTTTNNSDGKNQEDGCFGKVYSISQLLAKFR